LLHVKGLVSFDARQSCVKNNVKCAPSPLIRLSKIVVQLCYTFDANQRRINIRTTNAPFELAKHNSMDIVCKHFTDVMGIKQQVVKFGLGAFDLKLFGLDNKLSSKQTWFGLVWPDLYHVNN